MKSVTLEQAERGVYLDFEGTGPSLVLLLGVLYEPAEDPGGALIWCQHILDKRFWPVSRLPDPSGDSFSSASDFDGVLSWLRALVAEENRVLFAFSEHDLNLIVKHLGSSEDSACWESNLVNARPIARRWKTLQHPGVKFPPRPGGTSQANTLSNFFGLIDYQVPAEYGHGVAAAGIRAISQELERGDVEDLSPEEVAPVAKVGGIPFDSRLGRVDDTERLADEPFGEHAPAEIADQVPDCPAPKAVQISWACISHVSNLVPRFMRLTWQRRPRWSSMDP